MACIQPSPPTICTIFAVMAVCLGGRSAVQAEVHITGGGERGDGEGIGVRSHTTFPSLIKMSDGTLLCYDMASRNGGQTWYRYQKFNFPLSDGTRPFRGPNVTLRDGTILLLGRYTHKHDRKDGIYVVETYRSADNFDSYAGPERGLVHIPEATAGSTTGNDEYDQPVNGPFFGQSIVELPDGDLVSAMWGWFGEDQTPSGYPDRWQKLRQTKSRVLLVRSQDQGATWRYVTTIASDPDPKYGPEGFRYPSLALLPDGELVCLMRNGDGNTPLWLSRSSGDYHNWGDPEKVDVGASHGDLLVLSDGTLLMVYGKMLYVMASPDGGRTWDYKNACFVGCRSAFAYTGQARLAEVSPGEVLCLYHDRLDLHARKLTIKRNP